MPIRCEIVSQDRLVYEGDADIVMVPGSLGEMGILPGHAPLLSSLEMGVIRVKTGDTEEIFTVTGGFIEVQPDIVTIMADAAENVEDIDIDRAEQAMERASQFLEEYSTTDAENYMRAQAALHRSSLRLKAAAQHRKRGHRSRPPVWAQHNRIFMAFLSQDFGIDLGTYYTMIAEEGVLLERWPTVAAIAIDEQKIVEFGQAAKDMFGRVPDSLEITQPLKHGVIAEFEVTMLLLDRLIKKVTGSVRLVRPRIMVTVPYGVTSVESRAVQEAVLEAGAREVFLIPQPLAAAIGMDLPINTPTGNMILNMGGGATQAAVLAMYGIVSAGTLRKGGADLDDAISTYVRRKYGLIIAQPTAERIKLEIGAAIPMEEKSGIEVQGQDQVTGLPQPLTLTTGEIVEALQDPLKEIVETARKVLEKTPPELVSDIIDRGIALCGGSALLPGMKKLLTKELGVPTYLVDNPTTCVVEGASRAFAPGIFPKIRRSLIF